MDEDVSAIETGDSGKTIEIRLRDLPGTTDFDKQREFEEQHRGDWLEFSGFVCDVGALRPGRKGEIQPLVVLCEMKGNAPEFANHKVDTDTLFFCMTPGLKPWQQFSKGAKVTFRGKYRDDPAHLGSCTIMKAEGEPVPSMSAQELATYESDPDKIAKLYGGSLSIIVKGTVDGFSGEGRDTRPILKGTDKVKIHVNYGYHDQFDGLKSGDELTIIAMRSFLELDAKFPISLGASQRIDLAQ